MAQWDLRTPAFGADAQHLPVPGPLSEVSGQLRPFLAKLVVTLVSHSICTGEFSQLIGGCVLPCALFGGDSGWPRVLGSQTPCLSVPQHHSGGLTSPQVWLDIATLQVQSSPQQWALLVAAACHPLRVLAVPGDPQCHP